MYLDELAECEKTTSINTGCSFVEPCDDMDDFSEQAHCDDMVQ